MALPILDGNQSATTLSTILSSGQHITAHTVVSLGTQAITDIVNATSAGLTNTQLRASAVTVGGTVTVGNSVTISSLPAISGTVTANVLGASNIPLQVAYSDEPFLDGRRLAVSIVNGVGEEYTTPLPISGTVNSNTFVYNAQSDDAKQPRGYSNGGQGVCLEVCGPSINGVTVGGIPGVPVFGTVTVGNTVTIAGTVTIGSALPAGTNRIGVVTIGAGTVTIGAGTAQIGSVTASISNSVTIASFATSVTARLINPAGTAVTYAEVGTAGNPSIDVLSVQGVTAGSPVITTLLLSSTAISSGSFASLTSATLVPGNTARKMATVYNLGAGQLFINAGATATTLGGGFMVALSSGDFFECNYTTTTLSAIFATAGTASWVSH